MIRVLLADDHQIVRLGMKTVLELEDDIVVVGDASTADGAIEACARLQPDVILLDLRMPGCGHEAIPRIREDSPVTRILVLSTSDSEADVVRAMTAGAAGYLPKATDAAGIVAAVRASVRGTVELAAPLRRMLENHASSEVLSARELEVLELVAKGMTNREIARLLGFSTHTAKAHVARILEKMAVCDRTEAATEAVRRGLIAL